MPNAPTFAVVRTSILLAVGVFGIVWEVVVNDTDRPALLVGLLMLCGFPLVMNVDKLIKSVPTQAAIAVVPAIPGQSTTPAPEAVTLVETSELQPDEGPA